MDCLETAERSSSTPPGSRVRKRELARPAKPQPASPSYTAKGTHFPRRQQIPAALARPRLNHCGLPAPAGASPKPQDCPGRAGGMPLPKRRRMAANRRLAR